MLAIEGTWTAQSVQDQKWEPNPGRESGHAARSDSWRECSDHL